MPFFLASDNLKEFFFSLDFITNDNYIIVKKFYTKIGIEKTTLGRIDSELNAICDADNTIKLVLE